MRINLLIDNPKDVRNGYLNIDPFATGADSRLQANLSDLDRIVCNGEALEIVASDILGYFPAQQVDEVMAHWIGKLAHGGTIAITEIDLKEIGKKYLANVLSLNEANDLIHGLQTQPWQLRKSSFTLQVLVEVMQNLGLKILTKRIQNNRATIVAQRM